MATSNILIAYYIFALCIGYYTSAFVLPISNQSAKKDVSKSYIRGLTRFESPHQNDRNPEKNQVAFFIWINILLHRTNTKLQKIINYYKYYL